MCESFDECLNNRTHTHTDTSTQIDRHSASEKLIDRQTNRKTHRNRHRQKHTDRQPAMTDTGGHTGRASEPQTQKQKATQPKRERHKQKSSHTDRKSRHRQTKSHTEAKTPSFSLDRALEGRKCVTIINMIMIRTSQQAKRRIHSSHHSHINVTHARSLTHKPHRHTDIIW